MVSFPKRYQYHQIGMLPPSGQSRHHRLPLVLPYPSSPLRGFSTSPSSHPNSFHSFIKVKIYGSFQAKNYVKRKIFKECINFSPCPRSDPLSLVKVWLSPTLTLSPPPPPPHPPDDLVLWTDGSILSCFWQGRLRRSCQLLSLWH